MRLINVTNRAFPYAHLNAYFSIGPALAPEGLGGLPTLTHRALTRGTQRRDRRALAAAVERLGAELTPFTQPHAVGLGAGVLSKDLPALIGLLHEILTEPAFAPEQIASVRRDMLAELEALSGDDHSLTRAIFRQKLFPDHPMGRGALGTPESLARITPEIVRGFFEAQYTQGRALITTSGDVDEALDGALRGLLLALPQGHDDWELPPITRRAGRRVTIINRPHRTQAQLLIGHPSLNAAHPDLQALEVAIHCLGGDFSSRLMQEIRVKRGWSYGAHARLTAERVAGVLMIKTGVTLKDLPAALALLFDELEQIAEGGLSDEEIERSRRTLLQAQIFSAETPAARAARAARARLLGREEGAIERERRVLEALNPEDIRGAARAHLSPRDLEIVIASPRGVEPSLAPLEGIAGCEILDKATRND